MLAEVVGTMPVGAEVIVGAGGGTESIVHVRDAGVESTWPYRLIARTWKV
jgi:hypothetical protein